MVTAIVQGSGPSPFPPRPAPGNKRAAAKAATRARLIAAARHMFLQVGFFNTGIRDIAAHMGMSTGAVFSQVEDKDQLWRTAMNGPAPSTDVAEEIALVLALHPRWGWLIRTAGSTGYTAALSTPDYCPAHDDVAATGQIWVRQGVSPAGALRAAREAASEARSGGPQ